MIQGIDEQLAESECQIDLEENYVEGTARPTNTSFILEEGDQSDSPPQDNLIQAQQETSENKEPQKTIPESQKQDTSEALQGQPKEEEEFIGNQDQRDLQDGDSTHGKDMMPYQD